MRVYELISHLRKLPGDMEIKIASMIEDSYACTDELDLDEPKIYTDFKVAYVSSPDLHAFIEERTKTIVHVVNTMYNDPD